MQAVAFPAGILHAVDSITEFFRLKGSKEGVVEHEGDWKVIEFLFEAFKAAYPEDVKIFAETQKKLRENLKSDNASFKEGDALMRHTLNIPQKLYQLIHVFYPLQKWDKQFVHELATRIPLLSVPKKL